MFYLINILLCGISFAPFLFNKIDVWHAQGLWAQGCLAVIFSYWLASNPKPIKIKNKPLCLLHGWIALLTGYICYKTLLSVPYGTFQPNDYVFYPYFNFLCGVILYYSVVQYLNREKIVKTLEAMRVVIVVTLFFCVLQILGLSQFFKLLSDHSHYNNIVTGFLGNGTHLSGFLGCCIPLFLLRGQREDWLSILLLFIVLCFSGTTIGDPSISGFLIGSVLIGVYLLIFHRFLFVFFVGLAFLVSFAVWSTQDLSQFLNSNGRSEWLIYYWDVFKDKFPVTGMGLGKINQVHRMTPYPMMRHVHLEYLHFAIEIGLVGLSCILYMAYEFFKKIRFDKLKICLGFMVGGFLMSCFFNYPAHLWLPATWTMFAYASVYAIENEEITNGSIIQKRN